MTKLQSIPSLHHILDLLRVVSITHIHTHTHTRPIEGGLHYTYTHTHTHTHIPYVGLVAIVFSCQVPGRAPVGDPDHGDLFPVAGQIAGGRTETRASGAPTQGVCNTEAESAVGEGRTAQRLTSCWKEASGWS